MTMPEDPGPRPSDPLVVSPLARVRWEAGRAEVSAAGNGVRWVSDSIEIVAVLHAFARPRSLRQVLAGLPGLHPRDVVEVVRRLREAEVLVPPEQAKELTGSGWDSDALAFHRRSRAPVTGLRAAASAPAISPPRAGGSFCLPRRAQPGSREFREVLANRSSHRSWSPAPMSDQDFGELLWLSARNRAVEPSGAPATTVSRPYPSGGAAYSLELYPVLGTDSVAGIPAGVYRYRPESHALETVSVQPRHHTELLAAAAGTLGVAGSVPAVIVMTSRYGRVASSYGALAYSLVLAEVGAVLQTMYLVAEYLGLAGCASGGGALDQAIGAAIGAADLIEPVVGAMVIGRPAPPPIRATGGSAHLPDPSAPG